MKVKFKQDFQGRETLNRFYLKGEEAEFETEIALSLIQNKFAEDVTQVQADVDPSKDLVVEPEVEISKPVKRGKK